MENISLLKERWFKKEVDRLAGEGVSKADIARALDIKPQYLNSVLNGSRGLADTFLDKFIEAYGINQFDLYSRADDSVMSLRLMDKLDEKDTLLKEKDAENKLLQTELRAMEKELATLKAQHLQHDSQSDKIALAFPSDSSGGSTKDSIHTRKPTTSFGKSPAGKT